MRARQLLPCALAALLMLTGCANGSGLRVEGAGAPATSAETPSTKTTQELGGADNRTPGGDHLATAPVPVSLGQVRLKLLADKQLNPFFRTLLENCTVVERCLTRGATVNVMHSSRPQLVVMIHTVEGFVYGAFLIAVEPSGPRPVWSLKADDVKINASRQGDLVVEYGVFAADDQPCCPSITRVEIYRWNGRQMIKISSQDQKGD